MKDWDSEQLNDLPEIPQLVTGKLEFEYPVLFCCLYKQKKIFLSCSLIYKSIDIDMYKILFNPHANPERELLLFIQMAHWSEAIKGFRTCPRSISTHPWRLESNPIVQGDEAVSISYNVLVKMNVHWAEFRKRWIWRDSKNTKYKGNKPVGTESWDVEALITSLATLIVLPKGLRNKEDILPCLSLCFFSVKWEKKILNVKRMCLPWC